MKPPMSLVQFRMLTKRQRGYADYMIGSRED